MDKIKIKRIKSLKFYGIKSFQPFPNQHDQETEQFHEINFDEQITTISGQNGSGKTTIIEALQFALTGKTPFSPDKLQSFVTDPQLIHNPSEHPEDSVQGKIFLTCIDEKGKSVEVRWEMQRETGSSKKAGNVLGKFLYDGREIFSGNQFDMRNKLSELIKLPGAAWKDVIMSPQESATWPFTDTPAELKKKFDCFFGIQSLNKRLTHALDLKETMEKQLKDLEEDLVLATVKYQEYTVKTADIQKTALANVELQDEIGSLNGQIKNTEDIIEQLKRQKELLVQIQENNVSINRLNLPEEDLEEMRSENVESLQQKLSQSNVYCQQLPEEIKKLDPDPKNPLANQVKERDSYLQLLNRQMGVSEQEDVSSNKAKESIRSLLTSIVAEDGKSPEQVIIDKLEYVNFTILEFEKSQAALEVLIQETNGSQIKNECKKESLSKEWEQNIRTLNDLNLELEANENDISFENEELQFVLDFCRAQRCYQLQHQKKCLQEGIDRNLEETFRSTEADFIKIIEERAAIKGKLELCHELLQCIKSRQDERVAAKMLEAKITILTSQLNAMPSGTVIRERQTRLLELLMEDKSLSSFQPLLQKLDGYLPKTEQELDASYTESDGGTTKPSLSSNKTRKLESLIEDCNRKITANKESLMLNELEANVLGQRVRSMNQNRNELVVKNTTELNPLRIQKQELEKFQSQLEVYQKQIVPSRATEVKFNLSICQTQLHVLHEILEKKDLLEKALRLQRERETYLEKQISTQRCLNILNTLVPVDARLNLSIENLDARLEPLLNKLYNFQETLKLKAKRSSEKLGEINRIQKDLDTTHLAADTKFENLRKEIECLKSERNRQESKAKDLRSLIIEVHQKRLDEINATYLKDRWEELHPYDDISQIQLCATKGKERSNPKRIDYDYHFEMVTPPTVNLKMRGRSSTGEKLLASIIIRYALADVFAEDCGILGFDAPNENLDVLCKDNLIALLKQLSDVKQVIVTSPSETFLQELTSSSNTGLAYVIKKQDRASSIALVPAAEENGM